MHQKEIVDHSLSFSYSPIQAMALPVVEFSREGYKIRKVFG
jgi:hypothetical protein